MRRIVTLILASCFAGTSPSLHAQAQNGIFANAIAHEAARLAREPEVREQQPASSDQWSAVRGIAPAAPIRITTTTGAMTRRFVIADEHQVILLQTDDSSVPRSVVGTLVRLAATHPDTLAGVLTGSGTALDRDLRVQHDGVFEGNRKVADLGQILQSVVRDELREIRLAPHFRGSIAGAVGGGAAAFLAAMPIGVALGFKQCGGSCADEQFLMGAAIVGLPAAAAVLGARAFGHTRSEIIYRAP